MRIKGGGGNVYQESYNPDFDRHAWVRDHHEWELPAECVEVLKVYGAFYEPPDVANILGTPVQRVRMWLDYVVDMVCGGWPDAKPAETIAGVWFEEHRLCCMARAVAELEQSHYPLAARYHYEQPAARLKRKLSGASREACAGRWTPSSRAAWWRGLFRQGCGQWGFILPESQKDESAAADEPREDDV